jgi:hypothetical protein
MLRSEGNEKKELWGFSLTHCGKVNKDVRKFLSHTVNKVVEESFENNWELHFMPNSQCIFVKTSKEIWHFLKSRQEALDFKMSLVFSPHYPCCELY